MPGYLSDAARQRLLEIAAGSKGDGTGRELAVQYFVDGGLGVAHHQIVRGGKIVAWNLGELPGVACAIVHPTEVDAVRFALGDLSGPAGYLATSLVERSEDGPWRTFACPPAQLAAVEALRESGRIPCADVVIGVSLSHTPFGQLDYWMEFGDGRLTRWDWGRTAHAEVQVELPFGQLAEFHMGRIDIIELIQGTTSVHGEWTKLMLTAGLLDSREFRAAWQPHSTSQGGLLLAELGRLMAADTWEPLRSGARELLDDLGLAAETSPAA